MKRMQSRRVWKTGREYTEDVFQTVGVITVVSFLAAIVCYAEPFLFFEYAYSDLGMIRTVNGLANTASFVIFAAGIVSSAACMAVLGSRYLRSQLQSVRNRRAKAIFALLVSAGYLVSVFPHDSFHWLHTAGAASMVGSFWMLANLYLSDLRRRAGTACVVALHVVLHGTVVAYAALYFAGAPSKQTAQKIAVFGLVGVLGLISRRISRGPAASLPGSRVGSRVAGKRLIRRTDRSLRPDLPVFRPSPSTHASVRGRT